MKRRLALLRGSLFPKVLAVFFLIIMPFYVIGLVLNDRGSENVYTTIAESMAARLTLFTDVLELELNKIIRFQNEFVNDDDLIELSGKAEIMSDPDKTFAMIRLQKRLLQLKYSSSYIKDVIAFIPSLSYTVSANKLYDNLPQQQFIKLHELKTTSLSPVIYTEGSLYLVMNGPGWTSGQAKLPIYLLAVELSIPTLEQAMQGLATGTGGGGLRIDDNGEWVVRPAVPEVVYLEPEAVEIQRTGVHRMEMASHGYLALQKPLRGLNASVSMYVPETEITGQLSKYKIWYWLLSLLSVVAVTLFALWIFRALHQPLQKLVRAFRVLETGDLTVAVHHRSKDEFHYLYDQFNGTVSKLNKLIEEVYEQKYRAQLSELRQLQAQINPHFLYNSFFSMQAMARLGDLEGIERYTSFLGNYFQYVTRNGQHEVRLAEELDHAIVYTEIQKLRFRNRIQVEIGEIPQAYANLQVPRLILQPLVENAFGHGLEGKKEGGMLVISFTVLEGGLRIAIEDNGERINEARIAELNLQLRNTALDAETTGLVNVHRRLQIHYGADSGLAFMRSPLGGFRVEMAIMPAK